MTQHSRQSGTLPPRAVDQWHGVKEDHDELVYDDAKAWVQTVSGARERAVWTAAELVLAVVLLAVVLGIVWMGDGQ